MITFLVELILLIIPSWIVFWKLYVKAGEPGWAAIIPVYNAYTMGKIVKKHTLGIVVGVASVPFVIEDIARLFSSPKTTTATTSASGSTAVVGLIIVIAALVYIVAGLMLLNKFIKSYDRGIGAWILYIFIPIIGIFFVDKANFKSRVAAGPAGPVAPSTGAVVPPTSVQPVVTPPAAEATPAVVTPEPVATEPALAEPTEETPPASAAPEPSPAPVEETPESTPEAAPLATETAPTEEPSEPATVPYTSPEAETTPPEPTEQPTATSESQPAESSDDDDSPAL